MTTPTPDLLPALLDTLSDGVLVIDFDGAIRSANPAFCRMFDLEDDGWAGQDFGALFIIADGLDEFTEAVLDAVAKRGDVERRLVQITARGETRSLTVTAAQLTAPRGAVIVTVSDISEIRELREKEVQQAARIAEQLGELREAYRDLESRNTALAALTRRVRTVRGAAIGCTAVLFLGIGTWYLQPLDPLISAVRAPTPAATDVLPDTRTPFVVTPQVFNSTIALRGNLSPGRIAEIVSPIESHIHTVHVASGDRVDAGAALVDLDTGPLATELRQAEVDNIQAHERLAELEDWDNGPEMTQARRALRQAEVDLDDAAVELSNSQLLFDEGLIPATQYKDAERDTAKKEQAVADAARELEKVAAKGTGDALRVVRLRAQSATERLQVAEERVTQAKVTAPISGVVLAPEGAQAKPLARGRAASQGELLLTIADLDRLAVVTSIDEVDLHQVQPGQAAEITGPGFAGIRVGGEVDRVAARAQTGRGRGNPQFEIVILLDPLDPVARGRVLVGMSAFVTIVVHARPEALLVPLAAIGQHGRGQEGGTGQLRVMDASTGEITTRTVTTGLTTLDSVEVTAGLAAGETVMVPW